MKNNFFDSGLFGHESYEQLRQSYRRWWNNELGRPIVPIITSGHESYRDKSDNPALGFRTSWDFSISPEQFIDRRDWELSTLRWHGDAFPFINSNLFGPSAGAAFLGCTPVPADNTIWFMPPRENIPIEQLHFEVDPDNKYLRRVVNYYEAAMEAWHGSVVVGMVSIGGILDILSSFRGADNLLMDLYDSPDEVLRCVREIQDCWFKYYNMFVSIMGDEAEGYSQWFNLYSEKPSYIIQSDFSYMISPKMFAEFVAPELDSSSARLYNTLYHMDGVGQIPHLDMLLDIDSIKGIQWVPGDGEPAKQNWDELLTRILDSGKKLISCNQNPDGTPIKIAKYPSQLYFGDRYFRIEDIDKAKQYGDMFGIEVEG